MKKLFGKIGCLILLLGLLTACVQSNTAAPSAADSGRSQTTETEAAPPSQITVKVLDFQSQTEYEKSYQEKEEIEPILKLKERLLMQKFSRTDLFAIGTNVFITLGPKEHIGYYVNLEKPENGIIYCYYDAEGKRQDCQIKEYIQLNKDFYALAIKTME